MKQEIHIKRDAPVGELLDKLGAAKGCTLISYEHEHCKTTYNAGHPEEWIVFTFNQPDKDQPDPSLMNWCWW